MARNIAAYKKILNNKQTHINKRGKMKNEIQKSNQCPVGLSDAVFNSHQRSWNTCSVR